MYIYIYIYLFIKNAPTKAPTLKAASGIPVNAKCDVLRGWYGPQTATRLSHAFVAAPAWDLEAKFPLRARHRSARQHIGYVAQDRWVEVLLLLQLRLLRASELLDFADHGAAAQLGVLLRVNVVDDQMLCQSGAHPEVQSGKIRGDELVRLYGHVLASRRVSTVCFEELEVVVPELLK